MEAPVDLDRAPESVRIDRWLLAARFFRTRTIAHDACAGGKVEVNRAHASPHKPVRVGDRVRVTTPRGPRELLVRGLGERRRSAAGASALYEDVTPPAPARAAIPDLAEPRWPAPPTGARPSKRDRRHMARLRGR
jgi:ribosome-associated heat shock protein Hsp15